MGNFFNALLRGIKGLGSSNGPAAFAIAGRDVTCPHCGNNTFLKGSTLLNTVGMTFLNLDWADKRATTLLCAECGRIEWFAQEPERQEN